MASNRECFTEAKVLVEKECLNRKQVYQKFIEPDDSVVLKVWCLDCGFTKAYVGPGTRIDKHLVGGPELLVSLQT